MGTSSAMNTSNSNVKYKITVTQNSQNVANNTSNVTVSVKFYRTNTGYTTYGTGTVYCKINGTTYSEPVTPSQKITSSGIVLITRTLNIGHNADGTKTLTCSAWIQHNVITSSEQSYSQTLTTIPRKSTLAVSDGTLSTQMTLTIDSKATTFRHNIAYKCGTASGTIASDILGSAGVNFVPPETLASQNTTGTSLSITYTLTTYSNGVSIGSNSYTKKLTIPNTDAYKPKCSIQVTETTNYKNTYGTLVRGLSKLKVKVTATQAYGAAITAYNTTADGTKYTAAEFTTPAIKAESSVSVSSTVTDKRGRTSAAASASFPVIDYNPPTITSLVVHRCNADGTENDQGNYIRATFSASVTPLNNKNSATYKLRYKKTTATNFTEVSFSDLTGKYTVTDKTYIFAADGNDSYNVEVVVTDDIKTITSATSASTAFTLMNWGADGTSIAFGKVAEKANTFQNGLHLNQIGNRYALSSPGVASSEGFVLMANIEITAANADTPITFVISRRQEPTTMTVYASLRNSDMSKSSVGSFTYEGTNYDAYLSPTGDMSWGLYVLKGSNWDTITIQDWYTSETMQSRVRVTFPGTLVSQVPTPYYKAIPAQLRSILDFVYPVGSVYISYSHNSPADMFGGTWVRIENAFLWGVDSKGTIGQTGGEKTHTLTVNELPSHSHGAVYSGNVSDKSYGWLTPGSGDKLGYNTVATGGGAAHNNMPPYVQVSIWRRTA